MNNIKTLLQQWKDNELEFGLYTSQDEEDRLVIIEVTNQYLKITTPQKNHWSRINYYYKDGTVEEIYE